MNGTDLTLRFVTPRYFDRMLALQIGELAPVGISLEHRIEPEPGPDADLIEVPLREFLEENSAKRNLVGLPVFPSRSDSGRGKLEIESVIAIRRSVYESNRWAIRSLLEAFESARREAYERMGLVTSPALSLPWLVDYLAEDESKFDGDPFPVGFDANREAMSSAGAPISAFADETLDWEAVARAEQVDTHVGLRDGFTCRGIRYIDRTLPFETEAASHDYGFSFSPSTGLKGNLPAVIEGEVAASEVLLGDLFAEAAGENRLIGLPIITARRFPHRMIWVARGSGRDNLQDLNASRIGYPPGAVTAAIWVKELLEAQGYRASFSTGPLRGRLAPILDRGAEGPTLQEQVAAGELDAAITPYRVPAEDGGTELQPLFDAPWVPERELVSVTGLIPASNVIAMNRTIHVENPEAAKTLISGFRTARARGLAAAKAHPSSVGLPALEARLGETEEIFGRDPYAVGIEADLVSLDGFARHARELGLLPRTVEVSDLFAE